MGKSKYEYIELCQVEMSRSFYLEHEKFFNDNDCKLKAAYAVNPSLKDHPDRKILLNDLMQAKEKLSEWEFEQHYKLQLKK